MMIESLIDKLEETQEREKLLELLFICDNFNGEEKEILLKEFFRQNKNLLS